MKNIQIKLYEIPDGIEFNQMDPDSINNIIDDTNNEITTYISDIVPNIGDVMYHTYDEYPNDNYYFKVLQVLYVSKNNRIRIITKRL